jgi:hypothetical protein
MDHNPLAQLVILKVVKNLNAHLGERFFTALKMTGAITDKSFKQ